MCVRACTCEKFFVILQPFLNCLILDNNYLTYGIEIQSY